MAKKSAKGSTWVQTKERKKVLGDEGCRQGARLYGLEIGDNTRIQMRKLLQFFMEHIDAE